MADTTEKQIANAFAAFTQAGGIPKITSIFDFTDEAIEELALKLEMRGLRTPITQVLGFTQFTAQTATFVATGETTTSTSYTNLATVGPTLTDLPDGRYVILFGCAAKTSVTTASADMSIQVNSTSATDNDACFQGNTDVSSIMRATTATLSNSGSNSITAKFKVSSAATGTFSHRWLTAIRYANA